MIETGNNTNLLQEYVLDLLPPTEKQRLARQIGNDPALLKQVQQERQVGQLVKSTLQQASIIENDRLAQFMPVIPQRKRPFWPSFAPRQLAMVAMLFVLLLGGWHWFTSEQSALWSSPTAVAVTATMTHTPTATQTQITATETAVARQAEPELVITQAPPPPTPVAAVPVNTN